MRPDLEAMRPALRDSVLRCARGELPPNVALARLVSAARSRQELETALLQGAAACDAERPDGGAALRLAHALWTGTPQAWSVLRDVAATAGRWRPAPDVDSAIARWSALFDRAAELSPDASVALYSLGRADLLAAATEEIVAFARDRNLLGRDKAVVEIGCGNGRCLAALADAVRFVVGLDVSRQMLVQARRRCAALGNVGLGHSAGRDLSVLRDGCADLVIAVDSFPYLCAVGAEVAARHVAEARRVLRTGGSLLILNYSYRDNLEADAAELLRLANANGFALAIAGDRPFRHWDGAAFLLRG